jgi:nicotinate-nucleotide adenylyltransferase
MNIALFGGSFDPPHIGHKSIIKTAIKELDIQKLIVMPTYLNPFKNSSHFDSITRFNMIKDLSKEFQNIEVLDYEIKQKTKVSTIQTVNYLNKKYSINKFYLIIGADNLEKLHLWNNFKELNKKVEFIVASRDNIEIDSEYKVLNIDCDISSTKIRENLDIMDEYTKKGKTFCKKE